MSFLCSVSCRSLVSTVQEFSTPIAGNIASFVIVDRITRDAFIAYNKPQFLVCRFNRTRIRIILFDFKGPEHSRFAHTDYPYEILNLYISDLKRRALRVQSDSDVPSIPKFSKEGKDEAV